MALHRPDTDPAAAEAFQCGTYVEYLLDSDLPVPTWAWVNAIARGSVLEVAAISMPGTTPPDVGNKARPWYRARCAMAKGVIDFAARKSIHLRELQRHVLTGIELELAATEGVFDRGPIETICLVLESLEAFLPAEQ